MVRPAVGTQQHPPGMSGVAPLVSGSRPRRPCTPRQRHRGGECSGSNTRHVYDVLPGRLDTPKVT